MSSMALVLLSSLTACLTAKSGPDGSTPKPGTRERRAVLRVDPEPGARKFQGVWLELGDDKWVVDYRARALWKWFADREVIVTGSCYEPAGAAILGPHFRVDTLRVADRTRGVGSHFGFGPEQEVVGKRVAETGEPNSKAAGSTWYVFIASGTRYGVTGEYEPPAGRRVRVRARVVEPDLSYMARTTGEVDLWIVDEVIDGSVTTPPKSVACPDEK